MAVDVVLNDEQQVTLHIKPTKDDGGAASVDGVPAWAIQNAPDPTVPPATLQVAPDGMSCVVVTQGVSATVTFDVVVTADADLGAGVSPLTATFHIEVDPSMASNLNPTADPPVSRTAPAPVPAPPDSTNPSAP